MFEKRKVVAVVLLLAFSAGLNVFFGAFEMERQSSHISRMREFFGWEGVETWRALWAGWISVAVGLLIHVFVIRKFLPIHRLTPQWVGILFSGFLAMMIYTRVMVALNGRAAPISDIGDQFLFVVWLSFTLLLWFPLHVTLELWAYDFESSEQKQGSLTKTAEEMP